jgi:hypothetical protein
VTDAEGRFELSALPSGRYQVWTDEGSGERVRAWYVSAGFESIDFKPLRPDRTGPGDPGRRVRVTGPEGEPVARASVLVRTAGRGGTFFDVRDGTFPRLPDEPTGTTYTVFGPVDADGSPLPFGPGEFRPSETPAGQTVVALPRGRVIAGTVVDGSGQPVFGAEVVASPAAKETASPMPLPHGRVTSARDGRFRIESLGEGAYRLVVGPLPPHLPVALAQVASGTESVEIRLVLGLEAEVRVVGPDDVPVKGAIVDLRSSPSPVTATRGTQTQVTDDTGVARFSQIDPHAKNTLHASPPRGRPDLGPTDVSPWTVEATLVRLSRR